MTVIDTRFDTHHINFGEDKDSTAYLSSGTCPKCEQNGVIGWLNSRVLDQTHNAEAAQGWCPFILDYNGDGVIGRYTEPDQPADPRLDRRTGGPTYGIIPNPVDGSIWVVPTRTAGPHRSPGDWRQPAADVQGRRWTKAAIQESTGRQPQRLHATRHRGRS